MMTQTMSGGGSVAKLTGSHLVIQHLLRHELTSAQRQWMSSYTDQVSQVFIEIDESQIFRLFLLNY